MLRNMLPHRPGLGLIMVALALCLGLSTAIGALPEPPEAEFLEDWSAGAIPDRWAIWNEQNGTVQIVPGLYGGGAYFVPGGGGSNVNIGLGTGRQFVFPTLTAYDFTDADFFFELRPIPGGAISSAEIGFLPSWEANTTVPEVFIEYALGGGFDNLDFFAYGDTTDGYVRVAPYDPDGAHRFIRVQFTGTEVVWYTSPNCGTWTEQLRTGEITNPGRSSMGITARLRHGNNENTGGSLATGPGYLGPLMRIPPSGAINGPSLCLGLSTEVGAVPDDGPPDGTSGGELPEGSEGWCEGARDRWLDNTGGLAPDNAQVDFACGPPGGGIIFTPTVDFSGFTRVTYGVNLATPFDMTGKQVVFEADPWRSYLSYSYADLFEDTTWPYNYLSIWGQRDLGSPTFDRIDFLAGDGGQSAGGDTTHTDSSYFPDGVHRWWRFWHDPVANEFGIDTAADCGAWVNKVTRPVFGTLSPVKLALAHEGYAEGQPVERASAMFGPLYISDYPTVESPVPFTLCLSLNTEIWAEASPLCEDWCGSWQDRWEITEDPEFVEPPGADGYYLTIENECNLHSGSVTMTGIGETPGGYGSGGIRKQIGDATGKQFSVEYAPRPSGAYDSFMMEGWFVDYVKSAGQAPYLEFVVRQGGRGQVLGDPADVLLLLNYDPVAHRFFRFWHDVGSNTVGIDTSAACGTWVNRVSGSEALLPRAITDTLQFFNTQVYQDPGDPPLNESTSTWGQVLCADYPSGSS